jgi:predicted transcriptional regulator
LAIRLSLDSKLVERTLALSGERTRTAAVTRALEEFVARQEQRRLLELMGRLEWDEGYKRERRRNPPATG